MTRILAFLLLLSPIVAEAAEFGRYGTPAACTPGSAPDWNDDGSPYFVDGKGFVGQDVGCRFGPLTLTAEGFRTVATCSAEGENKKPPVTLHHNADGSLTIAVFGTITTLRRCE